MRNKTISEVEFYGSDGTLALVGLTTSLTVPDGVSPHALCRLCVTRMKLKSLDKILLSSFVDAAECGTQTAMSYAEMGELLGKSEHSVKNAIASLRAERLIMTTRVGRSNAAIAVSCDQFIRWAEGIVGSSRVTEDVDVVPDAPKAAKERSTARSKSRKAKLPKVKPAIVLKPSDGGNSSKIELSSIDLPDEGTPAWDKLMEEVHRFDMMGFDPDNLPPGVYIGDDNLPHFDATSGHPVPPQFQMSGGDEPMVDASEERAGTLAAAGRSENEGGDADEFTFGAETADTDIGTGVVMNPDL